MLIVSVGQQVRQRRESQGLSLSELARLADVSKGYLSEIENKAATRPSAATLHSIADVLGATVAELLEKSAGAEDGGRDPEVPESLRRFADENGLPPADVRMLAGIHYRGKAPETEEDWRFIFESIRLRVRRR